MKKVMTINLFFNEGECNSPTEDENIFPVCVESLEFFLRKACEDLDYQDVDMMFSIDHQVIRL